MPSPRLRSLQQDVNRPKTSTLRSRRSLERLPAHHNNLYSLVTMNILPFFYELILYSDSKYLKNEPVNNLSIKDTLFCPILVRKINLR